jgi:hypothetical protein
MKPIDPDPSGAVPKEKRTGQGSGWALSSEKKAAAIPFAFIEVLFAFSP